MSVLAFRLLITASLALLTASAVVDVAMPELVPAEAVRALEAAAPSPGPEQPWFWIATVPWVLAWLVGVVGLLLLRRWGRTLSLWTTVVGFGLFPLFGASLTSGWSAGLADLSATLWGAVISLAFYGPPAVRFAEAK